jgi:hypothetical protein
MIKVGGKHNKGQAFLFVFFLFLLAGILASGLSNIWESSTQTYGATRNGSLAFYLAQAGLERAKKWAQYTPAGPFPYSSPTYNLGAGRYNFSVATLGGNNRRLTATGEVLSSGGNVLATKQLRLDVNIATPAPLDNTWQEI